MTALYFGLDDYAANAAGYSVCMALSYILHRTWVFASKRQATLDEASRLGLTADVAYRMNLAVLAMTKPQGSSISRCSTSPRCRPNFQPFC